MKIRSFEELTDFLDSDLVWRKRELTALKFLLPTVREHEQKAMLRSSLCILYAHWEGYTKKAAVAYVDYVARKNLNYTDLSINFIGVALRKTLKEAGTSKNAKDHQKIVNLFLKNFTEKVTISAEDAIDTTSNLSFEVFENILNTLGLDFTNYATKAALIDNRLVVKRHGIAHGERIEISFEDYEELHEEVIALIDAFRNDIENAVVLQAYRY